MKREIEYFKRYGLSFVIDDFHRPDGKIVERTVPTNLETYTDRINGEEYETGNVEDLDYIDKFKIKFLFPVQAKRKFDGVKPIREQMIDFANEHPTILPKDDDISLDDLNMIFEGTEEKTKVVHLEDVTSLSVELLLKHFNVNY